MKKEFLLAFNEVLSDRQLPQEVIREAIEACNGVCISKDDECLQCAKD